MPDKKLLLFDAMAIIYRAHFAFSRNPRINSKGLNTGAVLGFTNTILDVINKEKPTHVGVACDAKGPTFRHEEFEEYKAHRDEQPEDITTAIPYVFKVVEAMGIPLLLKEGYEADDIVGTLAKQAAQQGFEVQMVTIDKDYAQLVDEHVYLYKLPYSGKKDAEKWGIKEVCQRWNLERPEQVADILGLQGDSSDNIPGIPGIGEKTAIKLVGKYGSVEGLIENVEKLKGKQKQNVQEFAEQGLLSKKLATIYTEVPVEFSPDALVLNDYTESEALKAVFAELEFRTLSKRVFGQDITRSTRTKTAAASAQGDLFGSTKEAKEDLGTDMPSVSLPETEPKKDLDTTHHDYHLVDTPELRAELIEFLKLQEMICVDTETTSLDEIEAEVVGLAICYREKEAFYVPIPRQQDEAQAVMEEFREVLESVEVGIVGQNIKYDMLVLQNYDIQLRGTLFDTMIAHYLIEPEQRHGIDVMADQLLNYKTMPISALIGKKGKNQGNMGDLPPEKIKDYACEDADITWQLYQKLKPEVEAQYEKLFYEVEMPLIPVLAAMEREGVSINRDALSRYSEELQGMLVELEESIYEHAGEEFNVQSPKQLGDILFDKLKLDPKAKRTSKTKQYKTNEQILEKLRDKHPIISEILEFRQVQKLRSTYVEALPKFIHKKDQRVHTSYRQAVTATGRLSSDNPNLQNIPIRTERGRKIREAFVPKNDDFVILSADYSQIELRIMAEFSQDEVMVEAFRNGKDIHRSTAAKLYKVSPEEVNSDMRRQAKTANFGIIYGVSAFGLSQQTELSRKEAGKLIESYFEEFPAIKQYMDEIVKRAQEQGYVETILGRRRYLRDINSGNAAQRGYAERNAINAPIQGSAADIIKVAMIQVQDWIQSEGFRSRMVMQVHDELVFEVHREELEIFEREVPERMKNALTLESVPLEVEAGSGKDWLEAH